MEMTKSNKILNSEKGAMIVEASFIMPIVIVVIFVLIYLSLIQIQQSIIYLHAQGMAQKISNISTFPGYEKFYYEAYGDEQKKFGLPQSYEPGIDTIENAYSKHDPYRYLGGVYLNKHNNYENELEKIVEQSMYFKNAVIDADIDVIFKNLSTAIKVDVNYSFKLPKFISIVGLNPNISMKIEAITYANDTAEFMRNTDLAFDVFDYFLKKYHLDEKISIFYKKIMEMINKGER
jgi:hypothetical protein